MSIEEQLRQALRPESAPPDFAAGIMSRLQPAHRWQRPAVWALAAALALAAILPPAISEYRRRENERGIEARAQLLTAISITRSRLVRVNEQIRKNTRRPL